MSNSNTSERGNRYSPNYTGGAPSPGVTADIVNRQVIITNLLRCSKAWEQGYGKTFCEVGASLVDWLGSSDSAIRACFEAASRIAYEIAGHSTFMHPSADQGLWLEHPDFRRFQDLVRRLLPLATQIRDWERGYIHWQAAQCVETLETNDFFLGLIKERIRSLDALVSLLTECCPGKPPRKNDPRSRWHSVALFLASRIDEAFRQAGIESPSRNAALSPLVLAVQDLLRIVGYRQEADAIRKVLGKSR